LLGETAAQTDPMATRDGPALDELIVVGRFQGLFGILGWLKVFSYTRPLHNLAGYTPWYVRCDGELLELTPVQVRAHNKTLVAQIAGYSDRDLAATLLGLDITIARQQLPKPEPGAYYWSELLGCSVVNGEGRELGTVNKFMETGSADVMVINGAAGEYLVPFVQDVYIRRVDLEHRKIVVDWDLDY
jgi:16S rRNA processing protein RimM